MATNHPDAIVTRLAIARTNLAFRRERERASEERRAREQAVRDQGEWLVLLRGLEKAIGADLVVAGTTELPPDGFTGGRPDGWNMTDRWSVQLRLPGLAEFYVHMAREGSGPDGAWVPFKSQRGDNCLYTVPRHRLTWGEEGPCVDTISYEHADSRRCISDLDEALVLAEEEARRVEDLQAKLPQWAMEQKLREQEAAAKRLKADTPDARLLRALAEFVRQFQTEGE